MALFDDLLPFAGERRQNHETLGATVVQGQVNVLEGERQRELG
jgi:hypothetical protein